MLVRGLLVAVGLLCPASALRAVPLSQNHVCSRRSAFDAAPALCMKVSGEPEVAPTATESKAPAAPPAASPSSTVESEKESSPVESVKESSPVESVKESSPVESAKEESSPVESAKESSPVESAKESSPVESEKESSPVESGKESSPVESAKESSPAESAKESSSAAPPPAAPTSVASPPPAPAVEEFPAPAEWYTDSPLPAVADAAADASMTGPAEEAEEEEVDPRALLDESDLDNTRWKVLIEPRAEGWIGSQPYEGEFTLLQGGAVVWGGSIGGLGVGGRWQLRDDLLEVIRTTPLGVVTGRDYYMADSRAETTGNLQFAIRGVIRSFNAAYPVSVVADFLAVRMPGRFVLNDDED